METYQQTRQSHWDSIAQKRDNWRGMGKWYHRRLIEIYQYLVSPNQRVLEIGCGMGGLLAHLKPARGVGIDFSAEMIRAQNSVTLNSNTCKWTHMIFPALKANSISSSFLTLSTIYGMCSARSNK